MKLNREEFLARLDEASYGATKKEVLEQSDCLIFREGRVYSFNDNVFCVGDSLLPSQSSGAVQAAPLLGLLKKLKDPEIEVTLTPSKLLLKGKGRESWVPLQQEVVLPVGSVEKPGEWLPVAGDFVEACSTVSFACASANDPAFPLRCVHLTPGFVEASDSLQIARWTLPTGMSKEHLVRKEDVRNLTGLGVTHFAEGNAWLHFLGTSGLVYSCRRFLEDFPILGNFLDISGSPATLPLGLADAVAVGTLFADDDLVRVTLVPLGEGWGRITLRSEGAQGGHQERRKLAYDGPPLSFVVAPRTLGYLVKKFPECLVGQGKLMVKSGAYTYLTCLHQGESDGREE